MSATEEVIVYKTVVPARWPESKLHEKLGAAKGALTYSNWGTRGGQLYELRAGQWNLLFDVPRGTPLEDMPWKKK